MPRYDIRSPRLHVADALASGAEVALDKPQAHYLRHVLRLAPGDAVLAFNGHDGEWRATLATSGKRTTLALQEQTRPQTSSLDLHYFFAPLKHERLDYMVQKAVEMGVSRLQPVLTRHTQVQRVNLERMRANAIEAAEQCGVLSIPEIGEPITFDRALATRKPDRLLVFCDEDAPVKDPVGALADARGVLESDLAIWNRDGAANSASPLPLGEVASRSEAGEGLRSIESPRPPHPNPLPSGERERAVPVAGFRVRSLRSRPGMTTSVTSPASCR